MLVYCGLCVLFKVLTAGACSENQQSTVTLTERNGTIFPGYFPKNATCNWIISAPVGNVFRILLTVYVNSQKLPCSGNFVKIYNGNNVGSDVMFEHDCSRKRDFSGYFFSSGHNVLLEVKTGGVERSTALSLTYAIFAKQELCSTNSTLDAPLSPMERNFTSPYYPDGYPLNTTCGWYITAPQGHVVKLLITQQLDVRDSVEVFDVDGSQLIPIDLPKNELYSKFQSVFVVFKSDQSPRTFLNEEKGILVRYSAVRKVTTCSFGNSYDENMNIFFGDSSGTIETPGYPSGYNDTLINECSWKIIVPSEKVVRIEFTSYRLGQYDYAEIADRINGLLPISISLSGTKPSFKFYSTGRELSIKVRALSLQQSGPGFIADYAAVPAVASGTCVLRKNSVLDMTGEGRSFSTRGYPFIAEQGTCTWNVTVNPGEFIKLTFWNIKGRCAENFIKVFDGTNSTPISLGKFCKKSSDLVYSRGNNLMIEYTSRSSKKVTGGFFATYQSIQAIPANYSCQITRYESRRVEMKDFAGEFASYNYPLPYSNDVKCLWVIERQAGHVIRLTFQFFDLQQSEDCEGDYVKIEQGSYSWRTPVGKFCGSSLPDVIQVNDSNMYVDFVSDSSGKYPGFHASYQILPDPAMGPCKNPFQNNVISLTGEKGVIFSPVYPRRFSDSIRCTWIITVSERRFVKLRIKSFDLIDCSQSSLTIRDGRSSWSDLLKSFCDGNFESSVFSSSRHLWVQFVSVQNRVGASFYAEFEVVNQVPASFACTASSQRVAFTSETGSLASYNYPLPYDDASECVWIIRVDNDNNIKLSFDSFNLSQSDECSEDYVEVRDGQFDTSDLLGKYCGSQKPSAITSDDWELRVAFRSSGKTKYPGFKATFETKRSTGAILKIVGICVGALSAVIGIIGACLKYGSCCKSDEARVVRGTFGDEAEGVPLQEESTKV
ncbi:cubilin-like isoform X2 [Stylophora pistillata]|uniref:Cubilin n=1 Tax=Stylophora pistillata TaxID=50429 RepID=A0A2B4RM08_STYPI|nr:cubilin-like isoform X2 [Stylophora pistillata]PFX19454.1 Cubilin [Stylophora pistillata]